MREKYKYRQPLLWSSAGLGRICACTCFSAKNSEGEPIFGRNFDYTRHPALLYYTHPPHGYASVAITDPCILGFTLDKKMGLQTADRRTLLAAPYVPAEGMNECGLAVAILFTPNAKPGFDPGKKTINHSLAMRLILDKARDIDEALRLLEKYNIYFSQGGSGHFLLADARGGSAIVEFAEGRIRAIRPQQTWQAVANFSMGPWLDEESCDGYGYMRFYLADDALAKKRGTVSAEEAMDILASVAQDSNEVGTIWSAVYNQKTGLVHLVLNREYYKTRVFKLKMRKN